MQDSILYFPHIEISNERWLKSALLLWEHVYRIVPNGYEPNDSREILHASENDLLRPINLEKEDLSGITAGFQEFLDEIPFTPAGLEYEEVARLHPDKIDSQLYPALDRYSTGVSDDGFLELPREVVRGYMFFLSAEVARRRQLSRCTDDKYSFAVSSYFTEQANFNEIIYDIEARGYCSSVILGDLLPFNIDAIPMDKIVKAANRSRDEREEFKRLLMEFSGDLHRCESTDHAAQILHDLVKKLEKAKNDLKASQGFMNPTEVGSFFAVGTPVAATFYSALLASGGDPYSLVSVSASILMGCTAAYSDYRRVRSVKDNPCGAAYLIALEKQLAGAERSPRFDDYMEEFIND